MKIKTVSITSNLHPAVGRELLITMESGTRFKVFEEWFLSLLPDWEGDPDELVGVELTQKWIDDYKN